MIWWLDKDIKLLKTLLVLTDCCAIELALPLSVCSGWHTWMVISYTKRGLTSFTAFSVHTFSLQMGFLKILLLMLRLVLILFPKTNTLLETIKKIVWHNNCYTLFLDKWTPLKPTFCVMLSILWLKKLLCTLSTR